MPTQSVLEEHLLQGVFWSFTGKKFDNRENFQRKFEDYAADMGKQVNRGIIFNQPEITILYEESTLSKNKEFTLKADNGASFTTIELLFKIHNQMVRKLRKRERHFFRRLTLLENTEGKPPVYILKVGN